LTKKRTQNGNEVIKVSKGGKETIQGGTYFLVLVYVFNCEEVEVLELT